MADASPALLASFVIDLSRRYSASARESVCGQLRGFLRYCYREGILAEERSGVLELPHSYRLSSLPRSISRNEVRCLLAAVDRSSARGRRDYAILVLLATYGLRAGDVIRLTLDDINWRQIACACRGARQATRRATR